MCGISGIYHLTGEPVERRRLQAMARTIHHRGPDDEGYLTLGPLGLAMRRLSIIDVAEGQQPISNEDDTVWVICNGEIYNYLELRAELEGRGHSFKTHSDVEVIVHLYEEMGPAAVQKLRGMFAIALWDEPRRRLVLARDRAGKKPLSYYQDGRNFIWGSEVKAILASGLVERTPDLKAVNHYLTYQYVPHPYSAFQGVKKLPPAHYLVLENGAARVERYWELGYAKKLRFADEEEMCEALLEKLAEAVRVRLMSEVPLGAFLSGGIDSSAVVGLMSRVMNTPVKTFSIGFREDAYNELGYARQIARLFGTEHHEEVVTPDALDVLPRLVWHYDEPYADSSAVPSYYLARMARKWVTVALNGDGGDESFAGYQRYYASLAAQRLGRWLPRLATAHVIPAVGRLMPAPTAPYSLLRRMKRFSQALAMPYERRYTRWMCYFDNETKARVCTPEFLEAVDHEDSTDILTERFAEADGADTLDATLYVDTTNYLPDDLLVKMDIATMANSLEGRSPFLDHHVMEFAAALPSHYKLRGAMGKYILKKALGGLLPQEILHRRKMGFGLPIDMWLRRELKEMTEDLLLSPRAVARGIFRRAEAERLIAEHTEGRENRQRELWAMLWLELWHRTYIDEEPQGPRS